MNVNDRLKQYKMQIDQSLETIFKGREPDLLYKPMAYPVLAGGKRLRPILLMLSQQLVGESNKSALRAGLAIELLHTFTLVHDDMMDHDDTRRGNLTVHKKWDEATAILSGDGLVTLAYDTLLSVEHPDIIKAAKIFSDGLLILCEGQALDKAFESMDVVSMSAYEEMIQKKTAKLIEVSCEIGAILGNGSAEQIAHIKQYAFDLGMAFQIQDDLLDLTGNEKDLGKPVGSDLFEKKKTFLVIHFIEHTSGSTKKMFEAIWRKEELSQQDIGIIQKLFEDVGTLYQTKKKVQTHLQSAIDHLNFFVDCEAKMILGYLTEKLLDRIS